MNVGPPFFMSSLQTLAVNATTTLKYALPEIKDPDSDLYSVSVSLQAATPFTLFESSTKTLTFKPKISDVKTTPYDIKITLLDQNKYHPMQRVYTLSVSIIDATQTSLKNLQETNQVSKGD